MLPLTLSMMVSFEFIVFVMSYGFIQEVIEATTTFGSYFQNVKNGSRRLQLSFLTSMNLSSCFKYLED